MTFRLILLLWLLNYTTAQDADCDFYESVIVGRTYVIKSPNHPNNYRPGQTCRWIALCPSGYNCRLDCSEISLPQSQSCSLDRLLVSLTGDPYLNGAQTYCGTGTLSVVSTGQQISVGLLTSTSSPGGKFYCTLVAQAASPTPACRCGERRTNRIVGGQETGVNEFPMMAALVDRRIVQVKCGATIITNRHVLTAAHCVYLQNINFFAIVVGEHDVTIGDSPATQAYQITSFLPHPSYSSSNYDYDVAIVTVTKEIVFSDRVGPVCLPFNLGTSNFTFAGSIVTVLGWGTQFIGGPTSNVLRKVDLEVLSQSTCRSRGVAVTDRQMCTFTRGKDACQDDSGGPLLYTDPSTGLLFQAGIISYGQSCATTTPGTNTRVTAVLGWIRNNAPYNYCSK